VSASPAIQTLDPLREEKRVVHVLPKYRAMLTILTPLNKNSALTIANGSNLNELASKFLKTCWIPLWGMVTWGSI